MKFVLALFFLFHFAKADAGLSRRELLMAGVGVCLSQVALGTAEENIEIKLRSVDERTARLGLQWFGVGINELNGGNRTGLGRREQVLFQDIVWNDIQRTGKGRGVQEAQYVFVRGEDRFEILGKILYRLDLPFTDLKKGLFIVDNRLQLRALTRVHPYAMWEMKQELERVMDAAAVEVTRLANRNPAT